MKKMIILCILLITILFPQTHTIYAGGLCRVVDSKFEPNNLFHLNNTNMWQKVDDQLPLVNLSIKTEGCAENLPTFKFALFSYGYDTTDKTIVPKVSVLDDRTYDIAVEKDGVINIPIRLGNSHCSGYGLKNGIDATTDFIIDNIPILSVYNYFSNIKFSKKDDETCKYFAGFLDHTPESERGTSGELFNDAKTKGFNIPGINNVVTVGDFLNKHGIVYNCSKTTCGIEATTSGDETAKGIGLNGLNAINNGFSPDPCSNDKEDKCYSLLSRIPIPLTGGDIFKGEKNNGYDFNNDGTPDLFTFKTTVFTIGDNVPIEHIIVYGRTGFSWFFASLYNGIIWAMIIAAVLRLMYLGYLKITTENAQKIKEIKTSFANVFIGLGILFSTYIILITVNPELLNTEPKLEPVKIIASTTDNTITEESFTNLSKTAPNSGKGYAMSGTYETPKIAGDSVNFEKGINELKSGVKISKIDVDVGSGSSTNAEISFTLTSGTVMKAKARNGTSGVAEKGQGKVGDKKTPKGSFEVGGKTNKGETALISISHDDKNAVLNSEGVNMGAAFLGLNIDPENGYRGIGIHGRGDNSLGTTYGCIRMRNDELLLIAPFVRRDAPVKINID